MENRVIKVSSQEFDSVASWITDDCHDIVTVGLVQDFHHMSIPMHGASYLSLLLQIDCSLGVNEFLGRPGLDLNKCQGVGVIGYDVDFGSDFSA